ncbi:CoB--CoM heterodisulfide reductase iron-sulfur subunit B family protein [uncultured Pseudodesulfovibrio sp.]|uniref:CoB--CoM heterodisulfide reductase iron-sulfur subunit B family protein n=1 Tax=uncultured Pseudodesulfovibrio sp. TaxID=2035858 RepID=UPI0029C649CF|nr:CoB--CoM heterodisulfide reductase iron-sulfur subunit B family protein [uncultured Pseudodesulfovibrio sp.]
MKYAYYPGCSLTESAAEFDVSTRAVMYHLGVELVEIPDWTCCGASAAEPVSKLMNYALPARNLAITEKELAGIDVIAPCSACYLNLLKVNREVVGDRSLHGKVNEVLAASGLMYSGKVAVRHILDVFINDVGAKVIEQKVTNNLKGMRIAPYYGCQILRPYPVFDDPKNPMSMHRVLKALGADVHEWDHGNTCCGASLMMGHRAVAMQSVTAILSDAEGADAIATVCPLCQMNLEAYQSQAKKLGAKPIPILYLTQLMGEAFGLEDGAIQFEKNLTISADVRRDIANKVWSQPNQTESGDDMAEVRADNLSKGASHV